MIEQHWTCLELLKTRGWEARDRDDDVLDSPTRFFAWARREALLEPAEAHRLRAIARDDPERMAPVVDDVRQLRTLLHDVFTRVATDRLPEAPDLEALEEVLGRTRQRFVLRPDGGDLSWQWRQRPDISLAEIGARELATAATDRIVGGIARSAADLLSSGQLERVKECDAHDCGWFFVDASRNKSRRWCDMAGCGNRAKAQRYRERHG